MKLVTIKSMLETVPAEQHLKPEMADRLDEVTAHLDDAASDLQRVGLLARSRQVRVISNNLTSYADALRDGDATLAMLKDVQERSKAFDLEVATIHSEINMKNTNRVTGEFAAMIPTLEEALANVDVNKAETAVARDISQVLLQLSQRNKQLRTSLPKSSVKTYSLLRLPVVLITGHGVDKKGLHQSGFEVSDFQGYPVLENQLMLAVRLEYARQYDMSPFEMAEQILETIHETTNEELVTVHEESRVPEGASKAFGYFWVMPMKFYNKFAPKVGDLNDWGIAV